jgi:hypothetical protein
LDATIRCPDEGGSVPGQTAHERLHDADREGRRHEGVGCIAAGSELLRTCARGRWVHGSDHATVDDDWLYGRDLATQEHVHLRVMAQSGLQAAA